MRTFLLKWYQILGGIVHYYSLSLLPFTLFSPWKRLVDNSEQPGFHPEKLLEQFTFNLISRLIGAIVRSLVFVAGIIHLSLAFAIGLFCLFLWLICPPLGLPTFLFSDHYAFRQLQKLVTSLNAATDSSRLMLLLKSLPGKFLLNHLAISPSDFSALANGPIPKFSQDKISTFSDLVETCLTPEVWPETTLKKININYKDLRLTAKRWDARHVDSFLGGIADIRFSGPGIGTELLFGYTPELNKYVDDLSKPQPFSHHLVGREQLVVRMERALSSGSSIVLTGLPGVGKKTVVLEFAKRAMNGDLGKGLIYKRVLELDYTFLMSQSMDISQKKANLSVLLSEASQAGNVILVIKDLHRLTSRDVEGLDFTDVFEKHLESGNLKIIAVSSQEDYERFLFSNSRLRKHFEAIEVVPPSKDVALEILTNSADDWEISKKITVTTQALTEIIEGSDKYITETPFPEKALEVLDRTISLIERKDKNTIFPDDVDSVLADQTGIALARLTEKEKEILGNLEEVLHTKLIGQEIAISQIAKSLRSRSVGAKDESRPIGSFLFLGPTGVGKTQTAKVLSQVYYGSEKNIIRFDMAEYTGDEGLARLIGSVGKNFPGALTTAIKNKPSSILLLDEIEKAPPEIFNLFLNLLDEGYIVDAFDRKISARHLFVIATSNAGSEYIRQSVIKGVEGEKLQTEVLDYVQKNHTFSPEFLNRFDGVVVFTPLSKPDLKHIASLLLQELAAKLKDQNISLQITDDVCAKLAEDGFEPEFGARPMRRIVDVEIGDIIGKAILKNTLVSGSVFKLIPQSKKSHYTVDLIN